MKRTVLLLSLLLTSFALATPSQAQPAPFDLQAALANAEPGDTIHVPAGVYAGPLQIEQPVTLEGQGRPVIQGAGQGDVITVNAPDVTIRGFIIQGSGDSLDQENAGITGLAPRITVENNRLEDVLFGVYLKEAPDSVLRGNVIHAKELAVSRRGDGIRFWYSGGAVIEDNVVSGSRDVVIWFSPDNVILNNRVENGRYGLHYMFSDNQLIENNVMQHNSVGAFLMYSRELTLRNNLFYDNHGPSGYGVGLKDVDNVVAQGNRMVGNRIGVYVDNSPREIDATLLFENNLVAYNETGATLLPLVKRNTYTGNVFQDNGQQIAIAGGGELSGNNWSLDGQGNYWSDYAGFDADGDQVGDLPYRSQSLYDSLLDKYPGLRLFQLSPAADAIDLAAKAFPVFQPRSKMVDEHPLMAPPSLPDVPGLTEAPVASNLAVALFMLSIATLVLVTGAKTPRSDR